MANPVQAARVQGVTLTVGAAISSSRTQAITVTNALDTLIVEVVNYTATTGYAASGLSGCGATWVRGPSEPCSGGVVEFWYGTNASSGAQTLTITTPGATDSVGCQMDEWSGISAVAPVSWTANQLVGTATNTTPTLSPVAVNLGDVVYVAALSANTQSASPASPYSTEAGPLNGGNQRAGVAYQVASTVTASAASWTQTSGVWAAVAIVLKAAQQTGTSILNATGSGTNAAYTTPGSSPDYFDSIATALADTGTGVLSGCVVSPNTNADFKFQVLAGTALLGSVPITVAAVTAQAVTTADGTNPRRDLVYVTQGGTVTYVAGTAAATPIVPNLPINCIPLGIIEVPASATVLSYPGTSTAYVNDKRVMLGFPSDAANYYTKPSAALFETFPRRFATSTNNSIGATGVLFFMALYLPAGVTIGHLATMSGTTAASTPTHWWFGLYDSNGNQLAVTADQTTTAWAASTLMSLAIATTAQGTQATFTTTYSGLYYFGTMMTATAIVTVQGMTGIGQNLSNLSPGFGGNSNNSLTTPPAFPLAATIPNGTTRINYAYVAA